MADSKVQLIRTCVALRADSKQNEHCSKTLSDFQETEVPSQLDKYTCKVVLAELDGFSRVFYTALCEGTPKVKPGK